MREFESQFGGWVIRYRWWIILFSIALVMSLASGGRLLVFNSDYRIFFSEENPQLLAFEALENTYSKNDNVLFVLTPADGDVFTPDTLTAVESLTERAWQIPHSTRVDSLSNFQHTEAEEDDLVVADLYADAGSLSSDELSRVKQIALSEPLLVRRLIAPAAHVTGVNVTIQLPGIDLTAEVPEVVKFARELAAEVRAAHPNIEVRLTGMTVMNNAFPEATFDDMKTLIPAAFLLMLVILGALLKSALLSGTVLILIVFSVLSAMGSGGHLGIPLSPPSASAPTIILTVVIANAVHVLVSLTHEMARGKDKSAAIIESLRLNLQPVTLASLTTAIGFLSMNFSDSPPFNHLGNLVAMGVMMSWILSLTFLPAIVSLLPIRARTEVAKSDDLIDRFGDFVVRRRNALLWGMTIVVIALVASIPRNELNDVFVEYFDSDIPFRADSDYTTANLTGIYVIDYSLDSGEAGGISNPQFLQQVSAFTDWFRAQPETLHVNTITDIMKRLNRNLHGDDDSWYKLPEERDLAAQYLLLYEMSLPYGLDLNNQINVDKSSLRFTATLETMSSNELLALERRAQQWLAANAPAIKNPSGSGPSVMFANIGKRNIHGMLIGTTLALVGISLLMIFALRSLKIGLISMIPNLVPAAMGFGLWGLFVGQVGLALSVVTSMTLGIVIDDTVHFLSKYLRARRERNASPEDSVRYAFHTVGRALTVTSIVLAAGFLVLSTSSFELNSGMGMLTAIIIVLALIADFLLLPPLLMKFEEKSHAKSISATDAAKPITV
jgi:predicted RND superfamily exporter protein